TITATPCGNPPDLTHADLPAADALVLAMAHPGRAVVFTEWLDPAIIDEGDPYSRDTSVDIYNPMNGPPYDADFVVSFRQRQLERNRRITSWVWKQLARLDTLREEDPAFADVDDLPFLVHATTADPRFLDLSLDASDRPATTLWGTPQR